MSAKKTDQPPAQPPFALTNAEVDVAWAALLAALRGNTVAIDQLTPEQKKLGIALLNRMTERLESAEST